jgi:hypothetical protein
MNILGAGNSIPGKKFVGVNGDRNRIRGTSEPFLKIPKKRNNLQNMKRTILTCSNKTQQVLFNEENELMLRVPHWAGSYTTLVLLDFKQIIYGSSFYGLRCVFTTIKNNNTNI